MRAKAVVYMYETGIDIILTLKLPYEPLNIIAGQCQFAPSIRKTLISRFKWAKKQKNYPRTDEDGHASYRND